MSTIDTRLFSSELVFLDAPVTNRCELFSYLRDKLEGEGYLEPGWLEAIEQRERAYPTGLRCETAEIAIPHVDPEFISKPYIAIVKPCKPVEFEHMAQLGDPVQAGLIINLGLKAHNTDQVAVLQALMEIFADPQKTKAVTEQATAQGLVDTFGRLCS